MKYLSLFSGIEAASVAWDPIGWEAVGFAEFEDFPKAVLAHRYPGIPDLGDVTKITEEQIIALGPFDILVGGSPCQDLSIAGHRAGMKNEDGSTTRSGLFDEQMRIFEIARKHNGCRYLLWENVPGAFSSNHRHDFAYVLSSMARGSVPVPEDGWRNSGVVISSSGDRIVEYRVLDAQFFGVPQRRRRIFALLDTGAWGSRQPILFEQESKGWDVEKVNNEWKGITGRIQNSFEPVIYENHAQDCRVTRCEKVCPTLHSQMGTGGGNVPLVIATGQVNAEIGRDICPTLNCAHEQPILYDGEAMTGLRRITPVEVERLQGFADNWTNVPWGKRETSPDSRRYKALGNSMAVPVMGWIGRQFENSKPVVRDDDAIRNAMIKPLTEREKDVGQMLLF